MFYRGLIQDFVARTAVTFKVDRTQKPKLANVYKNVTNKAKEQ